MKPYEPWEFCLKHCAAYNKWPNTEELKNTLCRDCKAKLFHEYLQINGQILEEGAELAERLAKLEAVEMVAKELRETEKSLSNALRALKGGRPLKLDLDRLEKLCREATLGPWEWKIGHSSVSLVGEFIVMSCGGGTEWDQYKGEEPEETDARFIAEARSALPALIARVRELEDTVNISCEEYRMKNEEISALQKRVRKAEKLAGASKTLLEGCVLIDKNFAGRDTYELYKEDLDALRQAMAEWEGSK